MRARMTSSGYVTIDENVLATAPAQNVSTGPKPAVVRSAQRQSSSARPDSLRTSWDRLTACSRHATSHEKSKVIPGKRKGKWAAALPRATYHKFLFDLLIEHEMKCNVRDQQN